MRIGLSARMVAGVEFAQWVIFRGREYRPQTSGGKSDRPGLLQSTLSSNQPGLLRRWPCAERQTTLLSGQPKGTRADISTCQRVEICTWSKQGKKPATMLIEIPVCRLDGLHHDMESIRGHDERKVEPYVHVSAIMSVMSADGGGSRSFLLEEKIRLPFPKSR